MRTTRGARNGTRATPGAGSGPSRPRSRASGCARSPAVDQEPRVETASTKSPPSIARRAVLAVALMIGFYLLALGIAAGLLYAPVLVYSVSAQLPAQIGIACILSALAILW